MHDVPVADQHLDVGNDGLAAVGTALEWSAVGHHLPPVVDQSLVVQQTERGQLHLANRDDRPTYRLRLLVGWLPSHLPVEQ